MKIAKVITGNIHEKYTRFETSLFQSLELRNFSVLKVGSSDVWL